MNFANLTPAERMKASGLIGLIVVVLFFVVYTMMGSLGGNKLATTPPPNAPQDQIGSTAPDGPLAPTPGVTVDPSNPFPLDKAMTNNPTPKDQDLYPVGDPFRPIRSKPIPSAAARSAMNGGGSPSVNIMPAHQQRPLPAFNQPAPWFGARPAPVGEIEKPEPPKYRPEIEVIGVVHGAPSVATLRVEGHVITARPGDLIAKGHRLVTVSDEGVVIRAHGELSSLRVGAGVNNSKAALASEG